MKNIVKITGLLTILTSAMTIRASDQYDLRDYEPIVDTEILPYREAAVIDTPHVSHKTQHKADSRTIAQLKQEIKQLQSELSQLRKIYHQDSEHWQKERNAYEKAQDEYEENKTYALDVTAENADWIEQIEHIKADHKKKLADSAKETKQLKAINQGLNEQLTALTTQFNELKGEYNEVRATAKREAELKDREIVGLKKQLQDHAAELKKYIDYEVRVLRQPRKVLRDVEAALDKTKPK